MATLLVHKILKFSWCERRGARNVYWTRPKDVSKTCQYTFARSVSTDVHICNGRSRNSVQSTDGDLLQATMWLPTEGDLLQATIWVSHVTSFSCFGLGCLMPLSFAQLLRPHQSSVDIRSELEQYSQNVFLSNPGRPTPLSKVLRHFLNFLHRQRTNR